MRLFADHRASCQGRPPAHWLDSRTLNEKDMWPRVPSVAQRMVNIETKTIPTISGSLVYKFRAHAITILELGGND